MAGEVVGINTAIFSQSGGNIGIGFAIPVNLVKNLVPELETKGSGHARLARCVGSAGDARSRALFQFG